MLKYSGVGHTRGVRRWLVLIGIWLAGTAIAMGLAMFATRIVGNEVTDQPIAAVGMSEVRAEVARQPVGSLDNSAALPPEQAGSSQTEQTPQPSASTVIAGAPGARDPGSAGASPPSTLNTELPSNANPGAGQPAPTVPQTAPPASAPPPPSNQQEIISVGGRIAVSCNAEAVSLLSAIPATGFRFQITKQEVTELKVEFSSSSHASIVQVECSAGTAHASIEEKSGSDDD